MKVKELIIHLEQANPEVEVAFHYHTEKENIKPLKMHYSQPFGYDSVYKNECGRFVERLIINLIKSY